MAHSASPTIVQLTFQCNSPSYLGQPRRPAGRQQRQGRGTSWLVLSKDLSKAGEMRVVESLSWTLLSGKARDPHIYSAFPSREEGSRGGPAAHGTSHGSPHRTTTGPSTLHLGMLAKLCSPQIWYQNPIQTKTFECDRSERRVDRTDLLGQRDLVGNKINIKKLQAFLNLWQ